MSILSLAWRERPAISGTLGQSIKKANLPWQPRPFVDFVIDGLPLKDAIDANGYWDNVSVIGSGFVREAETAWRQILLGAMVPELETGRVELYVCANCGDIDCGSITARLEIQGDTGDMARIRTRGNVLR